MNRLIRIALVLYLVIFAANIQGADKPKNIIILIGDGMGLNYVAANVLMHEDSPFRKFATIGLSITKSIDELITDSAAAATAIATGYQTRNRYISVDTNYNKLYTIFERAQSLNMATGVVVTDNIPGASPSPFYIHHHSRHDYFEIADQIVDSKLDVAIGGGAEYLLPIEQGGSRKDSVNLIEELELLDYKVYYNFDDLSGSFPSEKIFGLLDMGSLPRASQRDYSLGKLTSIAVDHLNENDNGFIMVVEGSQIDWAGHDTNYVYLLVEMEDFATAVNTALEFAENDGNTLVIVTSDHDTGGMTITDGSFNADSLKIEFINTHHTAGFVGVFAYGPGSELFNGIYDNYMIGQKLFKLLDY
ncbi:MAG: alkaline phosphatase [Ignavibacterium sp.]|nr:MAG: alkaline phosphatase [Ignavibacterium sp.]